MHKYFQIYTRWKPLGVYAHIHRQCKAKPSRDQSRKKRRKKIPVYLLLHMAHIRSSKGNITIDSFTVCILSLGRVSRYDHTNTNTNTYHLCNRNRVNVLKKLMAHAFTLVFCVSCSGFLSLALACTTQFAHMLKHGECAIAHSKVSCV